MFASKYAKMTTKELYQEACSISRRIMRNRYDYNAWERGVREWERIERQNPQVTELVSNASPLTYQLMFGHPRETTDWRTAYR